MTKECDPENLEFLKQNGAYPYEYMNSFERFSEKKLPDRKCFYSSTKNRNIGEILQNMAKNQMVA